jgi:hypothetical protein
MLTDPSAPPPAWRPATLVAFRFFAVYFTIYVLATQMLFGLLVIPTPGWLSRRLFWGYQHFFADPIQHAVMWASVHLFHKTIVIVPPASGDRWIDWLQTLMLLTVAVVVTIVWSIFDRRARRYDQTYRWFRVFLRFALGSTLLSYGFSKAFPLQMPAPQLTRLLEPYGNFSPMGVLWYSVGASFPYERFVGIVEVVAGGLLFFPRTQLLGSLVALSATLEVFVLNMTYDVPVKLFSFHLVVMSIVLIAPYTTHLFSTAFRPRGRNALTTTIQVVLGVWMLWGAYQSGRAGWAARGPGAPKPPLYGIWTIDTMTIDGVERLPLLTDYDRWRRVIVQAPTAISFWRMDDTFFSIGAKVDAAAKTIALTRGTASAGNLTFDQPSPERLVFDGTIDGHKIHMDTRYLDHDKFLIRSRGFNWVQELPFNR